MGLLFIFQNVYLQGEAPYDSYHRFFKRNAALTSRISAGTSMRGPTTAAKAWPLASPKVAAATAMVSSKLLPSSGEGNGRHPLVVRASTTSRPCACKERYDEVDDQRHCDSQHVQGQA